MKTPTTASKNSPSSFYQFDGWEYGIEKPEPKPDNSITTSPDEDLQLFI